MISAKEIRALGAEWGLSEEVVEKDYVLGWMLAAIAAEPALSLWTFKGGTALRKCLFESYRLSEDLDFTIRPGGPEEPDELLPIFQRISGWLSREANIALELGQSPFRRRQNLRGKPTTEGRVGYRGPRQPPNTPKLKIDITSDEPIVEPPEPQPIAHPYSDGLAGPARISCYSAEELMAEKVRALAQRCRPRDLYDVVNLFRKADLGIDPASVGRILAAKCRYAGMAVPDSHSIEASPFREEVETEWENMLAHQLPHLPPFMEYWRALPEVFNWLAGKPQPIALQPVQAGAVDPSWRPPRSMATWPVSWPVEQVRFAGANRLKVELDYRAKDGRWGPRLVEPYSLRHTKDGHLVLFVVNDRGELRSYRADRIRGARVSDVSFQPRFLIEF